MNGYTVKYCPVCGRPQRPDTVFCPNCGTRQFMPEQWNETREIRPMQRNIEQELRPMRAVWAAAGFVCALIIIFILQCIHRYHMLYNNEVTVFLNSALFGTGLYLLMIKGKKWKFFAAGILLLYVILTSFNDAVSYLNQMTYGAFTVSKLFYIYPKIGPSKMFSVFLSAALTAGATLLFSLAFRKQKSAKQIWLTSALTALWYLTVASIFFFCSNSGRVNKRLLIYSFSDIVLNTVILLLIPSALHSLCAMKERSFRLRGWGLVWCIIGIAAMSAAFLICLFNVFGKIELIYSYELLAALTALTGFILLVSGKKSGWFITLFSICTVIHADVYAIITRTVLLYRYNTAQMNVSILFWCLNPLITWFSIRKAWRGKR